VLKYVPANLGSWRQFQEPYLVTYAINFLSSSGVQVPFLSPLLSQDGVLTIFVSQCLRLDGRGNFGCVESSVLKQEWFVSDQSLIYTLTAFTFQNVYHVQLYHKAP